MTADALPERIVARSRVTRWARQNRRALSAVLIFAVLLTIFTLANPRVFTNPQRKQGRPLLALRARTKIPYASAISTISEWSAT